MSLGSPDVVLSALVSAAERRGARTEVRSDAEADLVLGSRSTYRMLGMWSPIKSRPVRLHLEVAESSGKKTQITADATSDVGWYLVDVSSLSSRQFDKAFDQLFEDLWVAAPKLAD